MRNISGIAIGSLIALVLVALAVTGSEQTRMVAFAGILVLAVIYAVWRRAWWMLAAVVVGGLLGLL